MLLPFSLMMDSVEEWIENFRMVWAYNRGGCIIRIGDDEDEGNFQNIHMERYINLICEDFLEINLQNIIRNIFLLCIIYLRKQYLIVFTLP